MWIVTVRLPNPEVDAGDAELIPSAGRKTITYII
jgi:hypothetical protein